jgi:glycosyltransferase involved in cell wall biosynthesis
LNREFYLEYGIPEKQIFSAPYFVENQRFIDQFRKDVRERAALRAGWGIDDGGAWKTGDGRPETDDRRPTAGGRASPVVFLFAGKLEPKKRIMDLLRAMELAVSPSPPLPVSPSSLVPGRPSIHLLVVGAGELMEEARQFAESRRLPVTFAGFLNQTEITRAYAAADCLVLPSDYGETWGLVVNEAMACGRSAIVSDRVGCGPDLIEEGVTGSVFPCGDIEALASKLIDFAADPERLVRMGERASERIEGYSVERAVEGAMQAIESVARGNRRPATDDSRRATEDGLPTDDRRPMTDDSPPSPVSGSQSSVRVLHVIPSLSPKDGGPSFALPLLARGLERVGIAVDVATTVGREETWLLRGAEGGPVTHNKPVTRDGVNYFYFSRRSEFYKVSLSLSKWLSEHIREYDLVHIHAVFSFSSYTAARLARRNRVPYILRPLGVLNRWGMQNRRKLLKRFSFRMIEQRIIRNAAAIHYTSQQERVEAEETGVRNEPVVIPLGVDLSLFRESPGPERFYEKFATARDRDIILFLSRLDPKKGLDLLLRAFAEDDGRRTTADGRRSSVPGLASPVGGRRSSSRSSSLLVIAGDGDDQFVRGLRRLAEKLGVADDILWTGFLDGDDKLSAMAAASLLVLPSYSENFGIALVEAMAAGLPCVMSDQVGIAVDATEYDAGVATPCEVGPLAAAMQCLLDDPELRSRIGANARRLVEERFSLEAMSASLVKLYERVLSRRDTEPEATRVSAIDTKLASPGVARAKR